MMMSSKPLTPLFPPPSLLRRSRSAAASVVPTPPLTPLPQPDVDCPRLSSLFGNDKRTVLPYPVLLSRQIDPTLMRVILTEEIGTFYCFYSEIKFGGRIVYSRTIEEVERAAEELLTFMDISKRKGDQCVLGLDIEWRPTFTRGVAPGKVAVMQICGDNNLCYVLHVIHSGIPKSLQYLLEDPSTLKVGVCIANDAAKVLQDYNLSITSLRDLSVLANQKLDGDPKKWSLSMLTENLICRQLPKPSKIRLGNWEVDVLSKEQLNYAATDAYVSWYLYQVLKSLPDPADNTTPTTPK